MIFKLVPSNALQASGGTMKAGQVLSPVYLGSLILTAPVISGGAGRSTPREAQMQFQNVPQDADIKQIRDSINKLGDDSGEVRDAAYRDLQNTLKTENGSRLYNTAADKPFRDSIGDDEIKRRLKNLDKERDIREKVRTASKGLKSADPKEKATATESLSDQLVDETRDTAEQKAFEDEVTESAKTATGDAKTELDAAKAALPSVATQRAGQALEKFQRERAPFATDLGNPGTNEDMQNAVKKVLDQSGLPPALQDLAEETLRALKGVQTPGGNNNAMKALLKMEERMKDHGRPWVGSIDERNKALKRADDAATDKARRDSDALKLPPVEKKKSMGPYPMTPTLGAFARLQPIPPAQPMPVATVATRAPSGGFLSAALGFAPASIATMTPTLGGVGDMGSTAAAALTPTMTATIGGGSAGGTIAPESLSV